MRAFTQADRRSMADERFARRYRHTAAHDRNQDGLFVVGQAMSETFCRPGCATRTPRPSRVTFYETAAAAHAAGLIPCPRCRPDLTPASPALTAGDDVAARAMRLIADGEIERTGVEGLAARVGATSRHVRRAVEARAGCGPLALARTGRVQLARLVLAATDLPISAVARASGFQTTRQFTAAIAQFYRTTPSALRGPARTATEPGPLVLRHRLPVRAPYDMEGMLAVLAERAIPEVEQVGPRWYARCVRLPHGSGHLRVDVDEHGGMLARLSVTDPADLLALSWRTRQLLDLDADPVRIDAVLAGDRHLAGAVASHPGVRSPGTVDIEETLLCTVIAQAFAPAAAREVLGALTRTLGEATPWGMLFPTAARIASAGRRVLPGSRRRVDTVLRLARDIASGRLPLHRGHTHAGLVERLIAYPGIGPRTAGVVAARVLGSPDVLLGDADVRHGAARLGLPSDIQALTARSTAWAPWRSYAGMHLRREAVDH